MYYFQILHVDAEFRTLQHGGIPILEVSHLVCVLHYETERDVSVTYFFSLENPEWVHFGIFFSMVKFLIKVWKFVLDTGTAPSFRHKKKYGIQKLFWGSKNMLKLVFAQHWKKTSKMKMPTERSKKILNDLSCWVSDFKFSGYVNRTPGNN